MTISISNPSILNYNLNLESSYPELQSQSLIILSRMTLSISNLSIQDNIINLESFYPEWH